MTYHSVACTVLLALFSTKAVGADSPWEGALILAGAEDNAYEVRLLRDKTELSPAIAIGQFRERPQGVWQDNGKRLWLVGSRPDKSRVALSVDSQGRTQPFSLSASKTSFDTALVAFELSPSGRVAYLLEGESLVVLDTATLNVVRKIRLEPKKNKLTALSGEKMLILRPGHGKLEARLVDAESGRVLFQTDVRAKNRMLHAERGADHFILATSRKVAIRENRRRGRTHQTEKWRVQVGRTADGTILLDQEVGFDLSRFSYDLETGSSYVAYRPKVFSDGADVLRINAKGVEKIAQTDSRCQPRAVVVNQAAAQTSLVCRKKLIQFSPEGTSQTRRGDRHGRIEYTPDANALMLLQSNGERIDRFTLYPIKRTGKLETGRIGVRLPQMLITSAINIAAASHGLWLGLNFDVRVRDLVFKESGVEAYALNPGTQDLTLFDAVRMKVDKHIPVPRSSMQIRINSDHSEMIMLGKNRFMSVNIESSDVTYDRKSVNILGYDPRFKRVYFEDKAVTEDSCVWVYDFNEAEQWCLPLRGAEAMLPVEREADRSRRDFSSG